MKRIIQDELRFLWIFFVAISILTNIGHTQSQYEEVVYLKNGSIIRGIIIGQIPNKSIQLQTKDGNIFVYEFSEIEKITRERFSRSKSYGFGRTVWDVSTLGGYGTKELNFGFGFRFGVTTKVGFYTGMTVADHFVGEGSHVLYFGGELGYSAVVPQIVVVQPYVILGPLFAFSDYGGGTFFFVGPALSVKFMPTENLSIGPDIRFIILPGETDANAFIFSLSIGSFL